MYWETKATLLALVAIGSFVVGVAWSGSRYQSELGEIRQLHNEATAERDSLKQELDVLRRYIRPDSAAVRNMLAPYVHSAEQADSMTKWFVAYGWKTGVSPRVLAAVSYIESRFCNHQLSWAGATGCMQVMPKYWRGVFHEQCGGSDLWNTRINICYGAHILKHYVSLMGSDVNLALGAYYAGPRNAHYQHEYVSTVWDAHARIT